MFSISNFVKRFSRDNTEDFIPPSTDMYLTPEELKDRERYIRDCARLTRVSLVEAAKVADSWEIVYCEFETLSGAKESTYIPVPVWDSDWGFREMFDTRQEALEEVLRHGGVLAVDHTEGEDEDENH